MSEDTTARSRRLVIFELSISISPGNSNSSLTLETSSSVGILQPNWKGVQESSMLSDLSPVTFFKEQQLSPLDVFAAEERTNSRMVVGRKIGFARTLGCSIFGTERVEDQLHWSYT